MFNNNKQSDKERGAGEDDSDITDTVSNSLTQDLHRTRHFLCLLHALDPEGAG